MRIAESYSGGNTYDFSDAFYPEPLATKGGVRILDWSHGPLAKDVGDGIIRPTRIRVKGTIVGTAASPFAAQASALHSACYAKPTADQGCLFLFPYDNNWCFRVKCAGITPKHKKGGFHRVQEVSIEFKLLYAALESASLTTENTSLTTDPSTQASREFDVGMTTPVLIRMTAGTTLTDGFTINCTTTGEVLTYNTALANGDYVEFNAEDGTVLLNGTTDRRQYMTGSFIFAQRRDLTNTAVEHLFTITGNGYAGTWATFRTVYRENHLGRMTA